MASQDHIKSRKKIMKDMFKHAPYKTISTLQTTGRLIANVQ